MGPASPPGTVYLWSLPVPPECIPPRLPEAHTVQGPHEAACHELTHPDGPALGPGALGRKEPGSPASLVFSFERRTHCPGTGTRALPTGPEVGPAP